MTNLTEGRRDYDAMLSPLLDALKPSTPDPLAVDVNTAYAEKITRQWQKAVEDALSILKRQDRIVWYLRCRRMELVDGWDGILDPQKKEKIRREYNAKVRTPLSSDDFSGADTLEELKHFLGLPVPAIQNFQFAYQPYHDIRTIFFAAESKWKETLDRTLVDDDSEVLIDFKNGWCWFNTGRPTCEKEAAAMGHCGNDGRQSSGDNLLSLRKRFPVGDGTDRWEPHLTFILKDNGRLGEMKGRGNEKPVERYHAMITALLKLPIIRGISGGGYMPENNFSIDDLPEKDALLKVKPELADLYDYFNLVGFSEELAHRIKDDIDILSPGLRSPSYSDDYKTAHLGEWEDMETYFRRERGTEDECTIAKVAEGDYPEELEWLNDPNETGLEAFIETASDNFVRTLASRIGVTEDQVVPAFFHMFPNHSRAVFEEARKLVTERTVRSARASITTHNHDLAFSQVSLRIDHDGKVIAEVDTQSLAFEVAAKLAGSDEAYGLDAVLKSDDWLAIEEGSEWDDHSFDDDDEDEDKAIMSKEDIIEYTDRVFSTLVLDLFGDDDQLSFDF